MRSFRSALFCVSIALLTACGGRAPAAQPTTSPSSATDAPSVVSYPPPGDPQTVQLYLDAVIAGHCNLARSVMVTSAIKDPRGHPLADARNGSGLCGRSKIGQITIDGWRWGDPSFDASGGDVFSIAVMLHVTSGHVGPKTSATDYPVPKGWTAYQLPMYLSGNREYVAGAPFR